MQLPLSALAEELSGKTLALFAFNKDCRNLLRAASLGLKAFPYEVAYLIDFSLPMRPRVRAMAEALLPQDRIVSDFPRFKALVNKGAFSHCMIFDTGYESPMKDNLIPQEEPPHITTPEALLAKMTRDYENHARHAQNAEFNMRWSVSILQYMTEYLSNSGVAVMNAYGARVETMQAQEDFVLEFYEQHLLLPMLTPELADVPVRFVLGEDFATGKTSYLINRMQEGHSGLMGDFWFNFISAEGLPPFSMNDLFFIKGVIANKISKLHASNPGKAVFIKYDGRLEEFVYGIPRDRTYLIKDMHTFFHDCRFVFVHKPVSGALYARSIAGFIAKYALRPEQVSNVRMGYDGSETPM